MTDASPHAPRAFPSRPENFRSGGRQDDSTGVLALRDEPGTSPTQYRLSLGGNVAGVDLRILLSTIGHAVQGTGLGEGALEGDERAFDRPASLLAEEGASEHAVEFAAEFRILTGRL